MPFLKSYKEPRSRVLEELTKKNGLRHAIFSVKGDKYVGEWKDNLKHGKGAQLWRNKHMYEGDWVRGKRNGYGVLSKILEDGVTQILLYEGDWKNGKPEGFGRMHSGGEFYEGEFKAGKHHGEGFGRKYFGDEYYEGEFKAGKRHGLGRQWYGNGSFYDGTWADNMRDGLGLFIDTNGNRYEGHWRADLKHGSGEFYHLRSGQVQRGVWNQDLALCSTVSDITFRQACPRPTHLPIPPNELKSPSQVYEMEARRILREQAEAEPEVAAPPPPPLPLPPLSPWFYVDCCNKTFPKKI